jgi:hypothetical protein
LDGHQPLVEYGFVARSGRILCRRRRNGAERLQDRRRLRRQKPRRGIDRRWRAALAAGSSVFAREVVRTGEESTAQLLFLDETSLSIGPQSEVTLDRFVFDPNRGAGNVVLNATRGAFRFVSGSQQPSSYQVRTPVATIGVRGTIFDMYLAKNNQGQSVLVAILVEGSTTMTIGGKVYNLTKPGQALVMTEGGGIQQLNWDSTLFSVINLVPFPLFGNHWSGDPHWTHIPNLPQDRIEQILGGGPTYIQDGYEQ